MSAQTILIHRDLPIINGFVQVPNNAESDKTRVTYVEALNAINGSALTTLSQGSGNQYGSKVGAQAFVRLPGLIPGTSYGTDPVNALANL